jgi:hypothetical protein
MTTLTGLGSVLSEVVPSDKSSSISLFPTVCWRIAHARFTTACRHRYHVIASLRFAIKEEILMDTL